MGEKNTTCTFDEWYQSLKKHFYKMQSPSGYVPDIETWCNIEVWKSYYDQGLTPEQAYFEES
jgi:hypothetical protein